MATFINLTPHEVIIISPDQEGSLLTITPSGQVARVQEKNIQVGSINAVPLVRKDYSTVQVIARDAFLSKDSDPEVSPFPSPQEDTFYIVPMLVGQALAGKRSDVIGPDFGIGGYRDKSGNIKGALGFIQY